MFTLFRGYQSSWLRYDVIAGVTVAAIAIPESLGYAGIIGLPPQTGLYCALLPPIVFALFASSRQLVVGADSATAALVVAGIGAAATTSAADRADEVAVLGLLTALFLVVMAVARLGFLADLISQPVLSGFLSGVGVYLIIGKLPEVLGIEASGSTWHKLVDTVHGLGDVNTLSALLGLGVVLTMVLGARFVPRLPAALLAVVVFSLIANLAHADAHGVAMVGALPAGLPSLSIPTIHTGDLAQLAASAASVAVVVLAQSAAVARSFGTKNDYRVDANADLFALGVSNAASAVSGGFSINGSPPRTAAGDGAGSRSQLVNIVMALVIAVLLLFAAGIFAYVPQTVLAAVVLAIGIHLIKVGELREISGVRRGEFVTALLALVVVAFVGVEQGVLLAIVVSLIDRLEQYHPAEEVLVHDGTVAPRLLERVHVSPDRLDDLLVYRFGASMFFENASYFESRITHLRTCAQQPVKTLILDCAAMSDIDFTGAATLRRIADDLSRKGGRLVLTELSPEALEAVKATRLDQHATIDPRLEHAVAAAQTYPDATSTT